MDTKIKYRNLHRHDTGMSYKEINNHIMSNVMDSFMRCENGDHCEIIGYLRVVADSSEHTGQTTWGEPNSWYKSGKFNSTYNGSEAYILVDPEKWLLLHDAINHGREGATESTVEWVDKRIENGETKEIPTPTLALEPSDYGEDPLEYVPVREGRSRGVGAKRAGLDKMPVLVSVRRPTK